MYVNVIQQLRYLAHRNTASTKQSASVLFTHQLFIIKMRR